MCLPFLALGGGAAAAFSNTMAVVGTVISAASSAAGIMQAQQQANFQAQQAAIQTQNARRQAQAARQQQALKHMGDVKAQQAQTLAYQKQIFNNSEAANRVYTAEQLKLQEARMKAAFKSQEIYAKQIGSVGSVLAAGQTGQSVGLIAQDAERQAGFATAQQSAGVRSVEAAAASAMEGARLENESANNQALSRIPFPIQAPQFEPEPVGIGGGGGMGIPSYDWGR